MRQIWTISIPLFFALTSLASAQNPLVKFTNKSGDAISQVVASPRNSPESVAANPEATSILDETTGAIAVETLDSGQANQQALAVAENILAAPVADGAKGAAPVASTNGECVLDLTFTFASGKTLSIPDMDICQIDNIVIE